MPVQQQENVWQSNSLRDDEVSLVSDSDNEDDEELECIFVSENRMTINMLDNDSEFILHRPNSTNNDLQDTMNFRIAFRCEEGDEIIYPNISSTSLGPRNASVTTATVSVGRSIALDNGVPSSFNETASRMFALTSNSPVASPPPILVQSSPPSSPPCLAKECHHNNISLLPPEMYHRGVKNQPPTTAFRPIPSPKGSSSPSSLHMSSLTLDSVMIGSSAEQIR